MVFVTVFGPVFRDIFQSTGASVWAYRKADGHQTMIGPNLTFAAQSEDLLSQRHPLILTQLLADILTTLIFENVLPFCCRFCFLCFPCRVWCEGKSPKEVTIEDAAMNVRFLFTSSETKRKKNRFYIFFSPKIFGKLFWVVWRVSFRDIEICAFAF